MSIDWTQKRDPTGAISRVFISGNHFEISGNRCEISGNRRRQSRVKLGALLIAMMLYYLEYFCSSPSTLHSHDRSQAHAQHAHVILRSNISLSLIFSAQAPRWNLSRVFSSLTIRYRSLTPSWLAGTFFRRCKSGTISRRFVSGITNRALALRPRGARDMQMAS